MSSQAESISACWTVLPCPSMVAAFSVARNGPAIRSAARSSTSRPLVERQSCPGRSGSQSTIDGGLRIGVVGLADASEHMGPFRRHGDVEDLRPRRTPLAAKAAGDLDRLAGVHLVEPRLQGTALRRAPVRRSAPAR